MPRFRLIGKPKDLDVVLYALAAQGVQVDIRATRYAPEEGGWVEVL